MVLLLEFILFVIFPTEPMTFSFRVLFEGEFGLGMSNYEEPFYLVIENLIYMHYGEWKGDITLWWLFERFDEDGSVLPINLNDHIKETEEEIFIETVEELWEFIKKIESK